MKANVGTTDRLIRIVLGLALLSLAFVLEGGLRFISLIGIIPLTTGIFRFCPLYPLFKINTCKTKTK